MIILKSFFILFILTSPVYAYIDPASGSAIMSAVIGFFVAIGVAIKTYWYKLKGIFTSNKSDDQHKN